ncbi:MAG: RNA polymerase factor sigma-54 [Holophagales bacterium]|nr:RNA polymerase factor sigma-54 [Holophagales bacterium]
MGLEQKLSLKLSQRLVMTPTLQQAIKLLQMTRLELQDVVTQEIVENPVLEEDETSESPAAEAEEPVVPQEREDAGGADRQGEGADGPDTASSTWEEGNAVPQESAPPDPAPGTAEAEIPAESTQESSFEAIDLESYFGDYLEGSSSTAPRMNEEGEEFSLENRAEAPPGLDAHLAEQLGVSEASPIVREACAFMIGNVDADGYLRITLPEVCAAIPCTEEEADVALALLQSFDPVGVGARNLPECLLIQARAAGVATPLLEDLFTNRLADLASKAVPVLARQMNVPIEELQQAIEVLKHLDPKPGRCYDSSRTIYVEPDVQVVKVDDDYVVLFNDDGLPRLKVSSFYRRLLVSSNGSLDGEGRSYLREKMRAAQWLMKSLDQRKRTIVRVAESIVRKQRDYLDWGVAHLRPLILRDVADDIGMHESTVSRVVSNKWMATPRGLLPMKFFFHSAISSSAGEDVSSLAVKGKIRALVEAEDSAHPLSDARLAELLAREGIRIARRTVAKYREELHIPSSSIRKVERGPAGPPA